VGDSDERIEDRRRRLVSIGGRARDVAHGRGVLAHEGGDAIAELPLGFGRRAVRGEFAEGLSRDCDHILVDRLHECRLVGEVVLDKAV
jgi:hypothetical protein